MFATGPTMVLTIFTVLNKIGITNVINCTLDVPNRREPGIKCVQIQIPDHPFSRLDVHFDKIADMIHAINLQGGKVLVHCVAMVLTIFTVLRPYNFFSYAIICFQNPGLG
jgi:hypothetical protein